MNVDKKKIQDLILQCLNPGHALDITPLTDTRPEEIQYFLNLCAVKRVYPVVYNRLKESQRIPKSVLETLHGMKKKNALHNIKLFSELNALLKAFTENNIDVIVLKGSYLAPQIYQNISDRVLRDIDILVKIDDIPTVQAVMEDLGYLQEKEQQNKFENSEDVEYYFTRHKDLFPYQKNGIHIEVHQKITYSHGPQIDIRDLWENSIPITLQNQPARIFHPENFLLHLCLHLTYQDKFTNALQALHDIKLLYKHHKDDIDNKRLFQKSKQYSLYKSLLICLSLCQSITGLQLSNEINENIRKEIPKKTLDLARQQIFSNIFQDIYVNFKQASFTDKIQTAMQRLFISRREIALRYGRPALSLFYPWYYLKHFFSQVKTHSASIMRFSRKENGLAKKIQLQSEFIHSLDDNKP